MHVGSPLRFSSMFQAFWYKDKWCKRELHSYYTKSYIYMCGTKINNLVEKKKLIWQIPIRRPPTKNKKVMSTSLFFFGVKMCTSLNWNKSGYAPSMCMLKPLVPLVTQPNPNFQRWMITHNWSCIILCVTLRFFRFLFPLRNHFRFQWRSNLRSFAIFWF